MSWPLNALYLIALFVLSPWLIRRWYKGHYRDGLFAKLFGLSRPPAPFTPPGAVWFHGVSVGEVHLLRQVVAAFRRRRPDVPCVISSTTDTGLAEARRCFPDLAVIPYPFDFSWAVGRTLKRVAPALVVLAESEVWPTFLLGARRQGVPVAVINARMSPRSLKRYRLLGGLVRWLFRSFDLLVAQTEEHAAALRELGAPPERVFVTGSVKYDGAATDRHNSRTEEMRALFGVQEGELVWVAGSTQAPEEEIVLGIYERARVAHPRLRLFLVPRHPDRFDEVARLLEEKEVPFVRRSSVSCDTQRPLPQVVLLDSMGELGALWGLADVAFVGGSMDGKRGGQNMIDPAAFGAAVTFGPHVWNFKETARRLVEAGGAVQVADGVELERVIGRLLADAGERNRLGTAGRSFVLRQQGATERTVALLDGVLTARAGGRRAA